MRVGRLPLSNQVKVLYRYVDRCYNGDRVSINLEVYPIKKVTPKGYWVSPYPNVNGDNYGAKDRWTSSVALRRFAYPTKKEAMVSFLARKAKQILILKNRLAIAEGALQLAISLDMEDLPEFTSGNTVRYKIDTSIPIFDLEYKER